MAKPDYPLQSFFLSSVTKAVIFQLLFSYLFSIIYCTKLANHGYLDILDNRDCFHEILWAKIVTLSVLDFFWIDHDTNYVLAWRAKLVGTPSKPLAISSKSWRRRWSFQRLITTSTGWAGAQGIRCSDDNCYHALSVIPWWQQSYSTQLGVLYLRANSIPISTYTFNSWSMAFPISWRNPARRARALLPVRRHDTTNLATPTEWRKTLVHMK